jgi:hypothetical protein
VNKDTTTTTIRISNETLRRLDEWADTFDVSRADVVRCVLGFFASLVEPEAGTSLKNDYPHRAITERLQVLSESQ